MKGVGVEDGLAETGSCEKGEGEEICTQHDTRVSLNLDNFDRL